MNDEGPRFRSVLDYIREEVVIIWWLGLFLLSFDVSRCHPPDCDIEVNLVKSGRMWPPTSRATSVTCARIRVSDKPPATSEALRCVTDSSPSASGCCHCVVATASFSSTFVSAFNQNYAIYQLASLGTS